MNQTLLKNKIFNAFKHNKVPEHTFLQIKKLCNTLNKYLKTKPRLNIF